MYYDGDLEEEGCEIENLPVLYNIKVLGITDQFRTDHFNAEEKFELGKLINLMIYHPGDDLTFTNEIKYRIDTGGNRPVYTQSYRYPSIHTEEVNR